MQKNKKILVIAPHMDDEVLGCAGTICKHCQKGDKVSVVFVAHRAYGHKFDAQKNAAERACALAAQKAIGYDKAYFLGLADEQLDGSVQKIIIALEPIVQKMRPEMVYLSFRCDNNQDHRAVFDACRVVLRPQATPYIKDIRMYEVPSSTEQSPPLPENAFLPNYYADITDFIDRKIAAMGCYKTELRRYPHPRSVRALRVLAQKRGIEMGFRYAEAFMSIRQVWD